MASEPERRLFKRKATEKAVLLRSKGGEESWAGLARDFSKGGVGIYMQGNVPCEGKVQLEFEDDAGGTILCDGRVIWCQPSEDRVEGTCWVAGVELISPLPEKYLHLLERLRADKG